MAAQTVVLRVRRPPRSLLISVRLAAVRAGVRSEHPLVVVGVLHALVRAVGIELGVGGRDRRAWGRRRRLHVGCACDVEEVGELLVGRVAVRAAERRAGVVLLLGGAVHVALAAHLAVERALHAHDLDAGAHVTAGLPGAVAVLALDAEARVGSLGAVRHRGAASERVVDVAGTRDAKEVAAAAALEVGRGWSSSPVLPQTRGGSPEMPSGIGRSSAGPAMARASDRCHSRYEASFLYLETYCLGHDRRHPTSS